MGQLGADNLVSDRDIDKTQSRLLGAGSGSGKRERERERKAKFSKASGGGAFRERFLYNIYFYIF